MALWKSKKTRKLEKSTALKQEYLKDLRSGKTRQTWAQWLEAKRTSPGYGKLSPTAKQRQALSPGDAAEISKFFKK